VITHPPDASSCLLHRLAAGDHTALERVVDAYGDLIWSLARRGVPRGDDPEDACQEVLLDVWRAAPRFDPRIASERSFIAMITRRRLIDRRRTRASRPEAGSFQDPLDAASPTLPAAEREEHRSEIARGLMTLSDEQRQVLTLFFAHGLSHEEIAGALSIPLGTVKSHARRGLIQLRQALGTAPRSAAGGTP